MTEPIKTSTPIKADAYVKVEAGAYEARKNHLNANIGAVLGGEISKDGTFVKAEAGYGTAFKAGIEAGHEFSIGKNMGLELSGNAQYLRDNSEKSYANAYTIEVMTNSGSQYATSRVKKDWHDGYKKIGAGAMLNFKGKVGNVKVGLEGGYRTNNAPDVSNSLRVEDTTKIIEMSRMFKGNTSGAYVTPKISAELNLGKSGHWTLTANADKFQGQAGIRYTF